MTVKELLRKKIKEAKIGEIISLTTPQLNFLFKEKLIEILEFENPAHFDGRIFIHVGVDQGDSNPTDGHVYYENEIWHLHLFDPGA